MLNVYSCIKDPKPLENVCKDSMVYNVMEKLNNDGKLTVGTDDGFDGWKHKNKNGNYTTKPDYQRNENDYICFMELRHPEAYRCGIYRLMGYIFNFKPFFKKYLVKTKYNGWQEQYAPNKTFIRKCAVRPSHILKIIEISD